MLKKVLSISLTFIILLVGCTEKEKYTEEQAIKNGDIVIKGADLRAENVERFATFQKNVDHKKTDSITLTYFTNTNEYVKSTMETENGAVTFHSNYEHYPLTVEGVFECKYLVVMDGLVLTQMCNSEDGEYIEDVFAFQFDSKLMQELGIHY